MLLIDGLGDRIRRQREKRGLKQQDIAHALTGTTLLAPSVEIGMTIVVAMVACVGFISMLLFRRMMVRLERTGSLALF